MPSQVPALPAFATIHFSMITNPPTPTFYRENRHTNVLCRSWTTFSMSLTSPTSSLDRFLLLPSPSPHTLVLTLVHLSSSTPPSPSCSTDLVIFSRIISRWLALVSMLCLCSLRLPLVVLLLLVLVIVDGEAIVLTRED